MKTVLFLCTLQFTVTITEIRDKPDETETTTRLPGEGGPRVMCPTEQVRATEGENATLPCHLDQWIDLSKGAEWSKLDPKETVHVYRSKGKALGPQSPQYKDRTTLNHEGLKTGNLALHISSVKQSDNGTYRCLILEGKKSCTVDLLIETPSQLGETNTTTSASAEDGRNHRAAIAVSIFIAVAPVLLLLLLLVLVLLVRNRAKIWDRVKRVCRRKKPEAETDGSASEMKKLNRAAEGDEDHDRQEENGDVV
uniref:myelin-oligodendrocyte glycoprotein-like n=1 Tax=Scatophagus argus TaxID=75038 RepID=UPI001ED7FEAA|nr:myelin-oligodendrocyte glycoprotein-like [Scatophagus argus]XP_046231179.1 myelin-oligodendrocyte glycoprotein-like [Scatophagus argus]